MNAVHPIKRKYAVTILRYDGTAFTIQHVKHVLHKDNLLEIYLGEHNVDRMIQWFPMTHVDHIDITEENE